MGRGQHEQRERHDDVEGHEHVLHRASFAGEGEAMRLPHPLDMPNDRRAPDYAIGFTRSAARRNAYTR